MKTGSGRPAAFADIQARLRELPGVRNVDLEKYPSRITVRCEPNGVETLAAEGARALLGDQIEDETEIIIDVDQPAVRSQRARFESVKVISPEPGKLRAQVVLTWQEQRFDASADDEASPAGELRCCATAAMRAVEKIMGGGEAFQLIGVKEIRIFDHDLVAVLLRSRELPQAQLVGTSVNHDDRRRSATLAVLSATNRSVSKL